MELTILLLTATGMCLMVQPTLSLPFPRGLANFLFSLQDGPLDPPQLADLTHFRSFSCTNREDGTYPDLSSGCVSYYRCLGGSVYSYVCPDGLAFDMEQQECAVDGSKSCPRLPPATKQCQDQSDGFYPDYASNCRAYYRCKSGELMGTGECERGAIWDYATASCGVGPRASCSPPSCWGLSDGAHPMQGTECAAYFTCNSSKRTDHVCPSGTTFDYTEKSCMPSGHSVCYESVCEGRTNGLHALPHAACSSYFRCFNAALIKVDTCPSGQIFDGWACVESTDFSCWSDTNGSCASRPDGLYPGDDKQCRGFFLCRQKKLVRSFRCSSRMVFDGKKCIDSKNYVCSSRVRLPDCTNKHDGYYTVEKSNCRSFYYCQDRSKLSEYSCPGSYVFNGEQCVDPLIFNCHGIDAVNATSFTRLSDQNVYNI